MDCAGCNRAPARAYDRPDFQSFADERWALRKGQLAPNTRARGEGEKAALTALVEGGDRGRSARSSTA